MRALLLGLSLAWPAAAGAYPSDDLLREHLWNEVRGLPASERPKIGLALSGGSVRALAHIGVLRILDDAGFPVDVVSGVSMGAIVGSGYAAGLPPEKLAGFQTAIAAEARQLFSKRRLFQLMLADSLLPTSSIERIVIEQLGEKRFDELPKPFACAAMDIRTGEKIIFRDGPLAPAVRASASLPGLFKPFLYRHRYLSDGGVVDYIPVDLARLLGAQWVLASVAENDYSRAMPSNVLNTLAQVIDIRGALLAEQQRKDADFVIDVKFGDVDFMAFDRAEEMVETGVISAGKRLEAAQESLILRTLPVLWRRWTAQGAQK
ncbi:MAG: patatin-like phospholipase family protein [Elusimicrobia bacterium]|nr:patatin-like phospholipase family protein [Elusimicrobiota bacterium]